MKKREKKEEKGERGEPYRATEDVMPGKLDPLSIIDPSSSR